MVTLTTSPVSFHVPLQPFVTVAPGAENVRVQPLIAAAPAVTFGTSPQVTVRVTGAGGVPSGTVRVSDGAALVGSATLASGAATVSLPADLAVGTHRLVVTYSGDAAFAGSTGTVALTVRKSTSLTSVSVKPKKAKAGKRATVRVMVATVRPSGVVTIKVRSTGGHKAVIKRRITVSDAGVATLKLPKLKAGTYKVKATYAGSATSVSSVATTKVRVRR